MNADKKGVCFIGVYRRSSAANSMMLKKASFLQRVRNVLVERITVGIGGGLLVLGLGTWLLHLLGVVRGEGPIEAVGIVCLLLITAWVAGVVFVKPFTPVSEAARPVVTVVPGFTAAGRLPPRNLNFTGRGELLESLHTALTAGETTAVTKAVTGLGGIGKTQLATEYCYRHAQDYRVIWWLRAEDPAMLASDYAAFAGKLNLPEKSSSDQTQMISAVHAWLEQNSGWLLVFDNAPGPGAIRDYLPRACSGRVIVTSRTARWGGVAETFEVPVLPRDKSIEFLMKRVESALRSGGPRMADGGLQSAAGQLAEDVGDLPLALEQAGAYIEETGTSIAHYREVLALGRKEVLTWRNKDAQYPESVAKTWQVSFERLEEESKPAAALLKLAAFLAPDDIPLDLLITKNARLPEPLTALASDSIKLDQVRMALGRFSLARFQGSDMTVHRLVQAVIRDRLKSKAEAWARAAVILLDSVFPDESDEFRFWPECARLLSHALAA
jgi:hypothetical protein